MNWIFRSFLLSVGFFVLIGIVAFAVLFLLFSSIRWIFTGRKPEIFVVMNAYKQWKQRPIWPQKHNEYRNDDFIEAEVREINHSPDTLDTSKKKD